MWYHGTRAGFTRGGYLFPRSAHGGPPTTAPLNPGRVQPTDDVEHGPGMAAFRTTLARVAAVSTVPLVSQRDALTGWVA
jgi:hypothetical protein